MKSFMHKHGWLRWILLAPLMQMYASNGCAPADALRDVADGLNNAANAMDGEDKSDFNQFVDDLQDLFD